jgi:hypothetical protein
MKLLAVLLLCTLAIGCGYSKPATTPVQPGTAPVISGLVPNNANHGGVAFTFEVDGTNFHSGAVINFNGAAQMTTVVSSAKLTTMIATTAIMNSGTVPVTVTNPAIPGGLYGGGTAAATSVPPMNFTIN